MEGIHLMGDCDILTLAINKRIVKVEYFPTHLMFEDDFTRLLMGAMFREFRNFIIGYKSIFYLDPSILHSIN